MCYERIAWGMSENSPAEDTPLVQTEHEPEIAFVVSRWRNTTLTDPIEDTTIEVGEWVGYEVDDEDDGYYGHWVDFSGTPDEHMADVVAGVHHELVQEGYMFNTTDFKRGACRVMPLSWVERRIGE